jgi:hypothetical protein
MSSFKNALEDVVIKEAHKQLKPLSASIGNSVRLVDVVVYALNRLSPLYATSYRGWAIQRRRLLNQLRPQITEAITKAIKTLRKRDRYRHHAPLPEIELKSTARALLSLRQVLGQADLRWRDVPEALEKALGFDHKNLNHSKSKTRASSFTSNQTQAHGYSISHTIMSGHEPGIMTILRSPEDTDIQEDHAGDNYRDGLGKRAQIEQLKAYLARTKHKQDNQVEPSAQVSIANDRYSRLKVVKNAQGKDLSTSELEAQQLEIYTLGARLEFSNVLEKLVLLVADHLTRNLDPHVRSQLNFNEVAAYALNRLPPMYAASDRDYRYQRQRAQSEIAEQITTVVKQGIDLVLTNPRTNQQPLPFEKFNQEYELALPQIKQLLKCRNITLSNVATIAADIIKFKRQPVSESQSGNSGSAEQTTQIEAMRSPASPKIVGGYYQPTAAMYS